MSDFIVDVYAFEDTRPYSGFRLNKSVSVDDNLSRFYVPLNSDIPKKKITIVK